MTETKVKRTATKAKTKTGPAKKATVKKTAPKSAAKSGKQLKVTQVGSPIGRIGKQRGTLVGLGLNKIRRSKVLEDTPSIRGMIEAVKHLVVVEDVA